jgi:hypothetical protein
MARPPQSTGEERAQPVVVFREKNPRHQPSRTRSRPLSD